jgi:hypothetical protein
MQWALRIAVFSALLAVGAAGVVGLSHFSPTSIVQPPERTVEEAPYVPPPAVGAQWRYTTPRLAAASDPGVEACTKSEADVAIGRGRQSAATLCLRRGGGYPYAASILLADPHSRLACPGCAVKVRFDDGGSQSFDGTAASTDGTDYTLFVRDGARLAAELKRASSATFTLPIQGAGEQAVTFDVAGLKWSS